ncbi:hypothetical protein BHU72_14510 [Desulfuribacillus stibiiarsenatis]|uniref:Uncharacterized protein n=1 Tax=Desulfuribacillus stibiiarsenatis TaxID=1390249 RepID=A0A1E5L7D3_9FIRM|nr:hypothetical protein [Desulfuribacillus stibiiarsenatis]OEH86041.1 hypothetical protein BHU72_14510 [Desulfuribacillus stibiiarsenatis]
MNRSNVEKQKRDLMEFLLSVAAVMLLAALGAVIGSVNGMFWFSAATFIVAFIQLHKRDSFYKWIHAFLLIVIVIVKFSNLGS